jgi:hypothetical protein
VGTGSDKQVGYVDIKPYQAPARIADWIGLLQVNTLRGCVCWCVGLVCATGSYAQDAVGLQQRWAEHKQDIASSRFGKPLVLYSKQTGSTLTGDVYALVQQPFATVSASFQGIEQWCDILILHINVKNCVRRALGADNGLRLAVGRKFDQPLADAYLIDLSYQVHAQTADYLNLLLSAPAGPMGTKDYRIVLEAIAIDANSSFVHMSYSYAYGAAARTAVQLYLATIARDKVGFSVVGRNADGSPLYVRDMRGLLERNTMRYFLALETYLASLAVAREQQVEKRLRDWFDATEHYATQLHEVTLNDYLVMKRGELARQKATPRLN